MNSATELNVFLSPKSVAVIGASEKPDSWGAFVMGGLSSANYTGKIYAVNRRADYVFNLPTFKNIRDIKDPVDLAVIAIPAADVEDTIADCGQKGVRGVTVITAGFAETNNGDSHEQRRLARLARSWGMRLLGPNVSGSFNLHERFNTTPSQVEKLMKTSIAAISQGGFAFQDILVSGCHRKMGVGKFIHTGNEADLTITDFLELFGRDPDINAIVMYIETVRDGKRFVETAKQVSRVKPIVAYKAGRSTDSARAAQSHTGALSSDWRLYRGVFRQANIVASPAMELLLPLVHSLVERPQIKGNRIAVVTMGGSWGVALVDSLSEHGLAVPEFSPVLQERLRGLGLVARASAKNPVDFGAAGRFVDTAFLISLCREILRSGEVDALVMHGFGNAGMNMEESQTLDYFHEVQKEQVVGIAALEKELNLPVFFGNHHGQWESQVVNDLNQLGIRVYSRLSDIGVLLSAMHEYWCKKSLRN